MNAKNTFLLFFLGISLTLSAQVDDDMPKVVTEEANEALINSKVYIPMKIDQTFLKESIDKSTPLKLSSKITFDVRHLSLGFSAQNGETEFKKSQVQHKLVLLPDSIVYKSRNKVNKGWPFSGYKYTDWTRIDCSEIKAAGSSNLTFKLNPDSEIRSSIDNLVVDIDQLNCNNTDIASFATLLNFNNLKVDFKNKLDLELKKLNFNSIIKGLWEEIQLPTAVNKKLQINKTPNLLNFKDIRFEEKDGKFNIGLTMVMKTNELITKSTPVALPELVKNQENTKSIIAINMPIRFAYKDLKEKFNGKFSGQALKGINAKKKLKKYATVEAVDFFGSTEEEYDLLLKLTSTIGQKTKISNPIFLHAKLAYDTVKKTVFIKNYVLDQISKKMLDSKDAKQINNIAPYQKMVAKFQLKVEDFVDQHKKIEKIFKDGPVNVCSNVMLTGVSKALELSKVLPQPDWIFCLFNLKGKTKIYELKIEKELN